MGVYIAKQLNKESKAFNLNGDEINLETRQVIKLRENREKGLTPFQSQLLQDKFEKQSEMEAKGIKPENWENVIK